MRLAEARTAMDLGAVGGAAKEEGSRLSHGSAVMLVWRAAGASVVVTFTAGGAGFTCEWGGSVVILCLLFNICRKCSSSYFQTKQISCFQPSLQALSSMIMSSTHQRLEVGDQ